MKSWSETHYPFKSSDNSGNQMSGVSYWYVCFDFQAFSHIEKWTKPGRYLHSEVQMPRTFWP